MNNSSIVAFAALVVFSALLAGCVATPSNTATNTTTGITSTSNPVTGSPTGVDCGTDFSCFMAQAANCSPAQVILYASQDNYGIIYNWTNLIQVSATPTGDCSLYRNYTQVSVSLDPAMIAAAQGNQTALADLNTSLANAQGLASV